MSHLLRPALFTLFAAGYCGLPAAAQFPQILYYRFNEGAGTTVTNSAVPGQGTPQVLLTGTPTWQAPGQVGAAHLDFGPATSGSVLLNSGWATDLGIDWTIECWVRPDVGGTGLQYVFGDNTATTPMAFRAFFGGIGGTGIYIRTGTPDVLLNPPFPMNVAGLWSHIAVTHDATAGLLTGYVNGQQITQLAVTQPIPLRGTNFRVGGYSTAGAFGGAIDEFRVWSVARTPAEIAAYYNIEIGSGFEVIGGGCAGSGAFVPTLVPSGIPQLGTNFTFTTGRVLGGTLAIPILGVSNTLWLGAIQLPLDLGLFGAPTCTLWLSTELLLPTQVASGAGPGSGSASATVPIPNGPYQGAVAYAGYLIVDPVNALGLINSPAARITIQ